MDQAREEGGFAGEEAVQRGARASRPVGQVVHRQGGEAVRDDFDERRIQDALLCTRLGRHLERVEERLTRLEDAVEAGSRHPGRPGELGDRGLPFFLEHIARPREDSLAGWRVQRTKLDETARLVKYQCWVLGAFSLVA